MTPSRKGISKKYVIAFIHVFKNDLNASILDAIERAYVFLSKHKNMLFLLSLYETTADEKQKIVDQFINHFELPVSLKKLMGLMLENKDISLLESVLRDLYCFYKKEIGLEDLCISTSSDLPDGDEEVLKQFFVELSDKKYKVVIETDTDLIAGIRMQSDTLLWEYSVAKKMKKLRFDLLEKV